MHQTGFSWKTPRDEARAIHQVGKPGPESGEAPPPEPGATGKAAGDSGSGTAATVEALKTRQSAVTRRVRREVNMVLDGVVVGVGGCCASR